MPNDRALFFRLSEHDGIILRESKDGPEMQDAGIRRQAERMDSGPCEEPGQSGGEETSRHLSKVDLAT